MQREENLSDTNEPQSHHQLKQNELNIDEKKYLLAVERGDLSSVKIYLEKSNQELSTLNINCTDPLGRSALLIAIEYENIEMIELLLNNHIKIGEALLHAINEEFVEAVEILLNYLDQQKLNEFNNKTQESSFDYHPLFPEASKALQQEQQLIDEKVNIVKH